MTIQKISAIAGAALLTGGLLVSAAAQAQPDQQRYDHRNDNRPPPAMRPDHRPPPPQVGMYPDHRPPQVGMYPDHRPPQVGMYPDHRPPPGAMRPDYHPLPPMRVGRPLPRDYRGYNYRVDNWDYYRLPRPRRHQYWVQYGGQFLLINPAGIVLQVFVP